MKADYFFKFIEKVQIKDKLFRLKVELCQFEPIFFEFEELVYFLMIIYLHMKFHKFFRIKALILILHFSKNLNLMIKTSF